MCDRAAKRTFPTPPKNKLALPVGSRALSHCFAPTKHRALVERASSNSSSYRASLSPYFSSPFLYLCTRSVFSVSRTSITKQRLGERFRMAHRRSKTLHPPVLTKIESSLSRLTHRVPLLRSTATKLGRLAEVTRGCTVYGRIYPG